MVSIPEQLLETLANAPGFDRTAFVEAHQKAAALSVRLHQRRPATLQGDLELVPWCSTGRYLDARPVFTLDPAFHGGAYYVQEASSMFLEQVLLPYISGKSGLRVLDLCAAPGGKSTLIASLLDDESLLIANEVVRSRASILDENITKWGYTNSWVTANDPKELGRLKGYFDIIVIDAPCSGSGLFRKDNKAVQEWSVANVQLCCERQERILHDIWPALKKGGLLVYATCSYSPQEDEEMLDKLADAFSVSGLEVAIKQDWGVVPSKTKNGLTGYRFYPDKVRGEGFFIAAVIKNEPAATMLQGRFRSAHSAKMQQQAAWLIADQSLVILETGSETISAMRAAHEQDFFALKDHVYFRKAGVRLGQPAGKDWIPAHDVALSLDVHPGISSVEVTKEQALRFLKKEDMGLQVEKGWHIVRYNGLGLGWIKSLGNRINNYLPKHWRIRMEITEEDYR